MNDARQTTRHVILIRPHCFGPNAETAASNFFQRAPSVPAAEIGASAVAEFDGMVEALDAAGADPIVFEDTEMPVKPDAVFPNNWISLHADGTVFLYPMEAKNRRAERRTDIVESLSEQYRFHVRKIVDLSFLEDRAFFLEGTGSMVLDRVNRVLYAALSSRTHMSALADFAQLAGYELNVFTAADSSGAVVYHTNVMMGIGDRFAVICSDSMTDTEKRASVLARLAATDREIIEISVEQMEAFAGNLLELATASGEPVIVMSRTACESLSDPQLKSLGRYGRILPVSIDTIEKVGGGSVRCMMAEVFLPRAADAGGH